MMSEQVRVTPEQARQLISKTHGRPTPSNTLAITEAHTRSEELREGGTLDVPTVILSGTSIEPHQVMYIFDTGGRLAAQTVANESSQWTALLPLLDRGEHILVARVLGGGGWLYSEPWRLYVAVGERIRLTGFAPPPIGPISVPCGDPYPVESNDPVGEIGLNLRGEVGTIFQIANTGESPEPPPPGSLLWGPVVTLSAHGITVRENRLGSPPVHNWYHVRTVDSEAAIVGKCLGNFVRAT